MSLNLPLQRTQRRVKFKIWKMWKTLPVNLKVTQLLAVFIGVQIRYDFCLKSASPFWWDLNLPISLPLSSSHSYFALNISLFLPPRILFLLSNHYLISTTPSKSNTNLPAPPPPPPPPPTLTTISLFPLPAVFLPTVSRHQFSTLKIKFLLSANVSLVSSSFSFLVSSKTRRRRHSWRFRLPFIPYCKCDNNNI